MSEIKLEAKEGIDKDTIESVKLLGEKYKYGFSTNIDMDYAPPGNPSVQNDRIECNRGLVIDWHEHDDPTLNLPDGYVFLERRFSITF